MLAAANNPKPAAIPERSDGALNAALSPPPNQLVIHDLGTRQPNPLSDPKNLALLRGLIKAGDEVQNSFLSRKDVFETRLANSNWFTKPFIRLTEPTDPRGGVSYWQLIPSFNEAKIKDRDGCLTGLQKAGLIECTVIWGYRTPVKEYRVTDLGRRLAKEEQQPERLPAAG